MTILIAGFPGASKRCKTATNAAQQYVNSGSYSSGLASLYTYGAFYPCAGYGNCWRPYGVGLGWSPFDAVLVHRSLDRHVFHRQSAVGLDTVSLRRMDLRSGIWLDVGAQWLWERFLRRQSALAASDGNVVALAYWPDWHRPGAPLDVHGKTPINLAKGVFPVSGGAISRSVPVGAGEQWKIVKNVPRNTVTSNVPVAAPPERVSRTLVGGNLGAHVVTMDRNSSIAYDAREHRFVNTNSAPSQALANSAAHTQNGAVAADRAIGKSSIAVAPSGSQNMRVTGGAAVPNARASAAPAPARTSIPASRATMPPPAARSTAMGGARTGSAGGGSVSQGSSRASSAPASTAAPRASAPKLVRKFLRRPPTLIHSWTILRTGAALPRPSLPRLSNSGTVMQIPNRSEHAN